MGIGERNGGNDGNAGNQDENDGNKGIQSENARNQGGNAENRGGSLRNQGWNEENRGGNAGNQGGSAGIGGGSEVNQCENLRKGVKMMKEKIRRAIKIKGNVCRYKNIVLTVWCEKQLK